MSDKPPDALVDSKNALPRLKSEVISDVAYDNLQAEEGSTNPKGLAELSLMATTTNGMVASMYSSKTMGVPLDLKEMVLALNKQVAAIKSGDQGQLEALLLSQVSTLNAIFVELARRAALNMGQNLDATEAYMRLALRAQNQVRATAETLATMKNPSVVIARQANITSGPQQVNNMPFAGAGAQTQNAPNQLSGDAN